MEIINLIKQRITNGTGIGTNSHVEPLDHIQFPTKMVKIALAIYLFQNGATIAWWSIKDGVLFPWLIFFYSFLQVGWIWNKAVEYWKNQNIVAANDSTIIDIYGGNDGGNDTDSDSDSNYNQALSAPDINIEISGIVPVQGQLAEIDEHPLQPSQ